MARARCKDWKRKRAKMFKKLFTKILNVIYFSKGMYVHMCVCVWWWVECAIIPRARYKKDKLYDDRRYAENETFRRHTDRWIFVVYI